MSKLLQCRNYHLAKILCLSMALLFLEGAIGEHILSTENIELSEKEIEEKAEKLEKEIEEKSEIDHFYAYRKHLYKISIAHNNLNAFWIQSNSAFCEIISPPPELKIS